MQLPHIDNGKKFDWGKTSRLYAKYRDIYPPVFLNRLSAAAGIVRGVNVLDLGTGTGVIPRLLYGTGANFTGIDISENQIAEARRLAEEDGMHINFLCSPAEQCIFPAAAFDSVTACQCFTYFNHQKLADKLCTVLKDGGIFCAAYMGWLPYEDDIAARSEQLILKFNPSWNGCGDTPKPLAIPDCYFKYFEIEQREVFRFTVPFSREGWHGRILSCRGVSAALSEDRLEDFSREHAKMLHKIAPEQFNVKHYAAITTLKKL